MKFKLPILLCVSVLVSLFLATFSAFANTSTSYKYNASDVIRYALTAHGIRYKLRSHRGAINRWYPNRSKQSRLRRNKYNRIRTVVGGNTDCSGLYSAAIRWGGYRHPKARKSAIGTASIYSYARRKRNGFYFVKGSPSKVVRHGDGLIARRKYRGHVLLFNGVNSRGRVETVEAGGRKRGVGAFATSWSSLARRRMKVVRHRSIYPDVQSRRRVFRPAEASARVTTYRRHVMPPPPQQKPEPPREGSFYRVRSGDSDTAIAARFGLSLAKLASINPGVNLKRLYVGQKLRVLDRRTA